MLELISSTIRNIGLGVFVNGAYAWQFSEVGNVALWAIVEGVIIMILAGYAEIRSRKCQI